MNAIRYAAALRRIVEWRGYSTKHHDEYEDDSEEYWMQREYERGANDMLETLQAIADEALDPDKAKREAELNAIKF